MAGLDPAIHVFKGEIATREDVGGRVKPGHGDVGDVLCHSAAARLWGRQVASWSQLSASMNSAQRR